MAKEIVLNIKANTKDVEKGVKNVEKNTKDANKSAQGLSATTGVLGGKAQAAAAGFTKLKAGVLTTVRAMATLKGAIAATGIGALVLAFGGLVSFFTKTERGAQALRKITAGLSAAFAVLVDKVIAFGEGIFKAFTSPQEAIKGLGESIQNFFIGKIEDAIGIFQKFGGAFSKIFSGDFKEGFAELGEAATDAFVEFTPAGALIDGVRAVGDEVKDIADEVSREVEAAVRIAEVLNQVKVAERELSVERARAQIIINENRLIAEDRTKSEEERIQALQAAFAIETEIAESEVANEKRRVEAIQERINLGESTEKDFEELAQAQIRLANLEAQSLQRNRRVFSRTEGIKAEAAAKRKAEETELRKEIEEREKREAEFEKQFTEIKAANDLAQIEDERKRAEAEIEIEREKALRELELTKFTEEQKAQIRAEINEQADIKLAAQRLEAQEEAAKKEIELQKKVSDAKTSLEQQALGAVNDLLGAAAEKNKAFAVLQTLITTFTSAQGAFAAQQVPGDPSSLPRGIAAAALATASGLSRLASIRNANSNGVTAGASSGSGGVNFSRFTPDNRTPQDVNIVNQRQQDPVRAFVLTSDVNDGQAVAQRLKSKTVL